MNHSPNTNTRKTRSASIGISGCPRKAVDIALQRRSRNASESHQILLRSVRNCTTGTLSRHRHLRKRNLSSNMDTPAPHEHPAKRHPQPQQIPRPNSPSCKCRLCTSGTSPDDRTSNMDHEVAPDISGERSTTFGLDRVNTWLFCEKDGFYPQRFFIRHRLPEIEKIIKTRGGIIETDIEMSTVIIVSSIWAESVQFRQDIVRERGNGDQPVLVDTWVRECDRQNLRVNIDPYDIERNGPVSSASSPKNRKNKGEPSLNHKAGSCGPESAASTLKNTPPFTAVPGTGKRSIPYSKHEIQLAKTTWIDRTHQDKYIPVTVVSSELHRLYPNRTAKSWESLLYRLFQQDSQLASLKPQNRFVSDSREPSPPSMNLRSSLPPSLQADSTLTNAGARPQITHQETQWMFDLYRLRYSQLQHSQYECDITTVLEDLINELDRKKPKYGIENWRSEVHKNKVELEKLWEEFARNIRSDTPSDNDESSVGDESSARDSGVGNSSSKRKLYTEEENYQIAKFLSRYPISERTRISVWKLYQSMYPSRTVVALHHHYARKERAYLDYLADQLRKSTYGDGLRNAHTASMSPCDGKEKASSGQTSPFSGYRKRPRCTATGDNEEHLRKHVKWEDPQADE
ncbi:hypothetical protein FRC03_005557 [Tulasnella sp. 419]|nr:hypothetical protein FRC03_005557 [Tulasnella sp. 419]